MIVRVVSWILILALIVIGVVYARFKNHTINIRTEIEINAPASAVWQVLTELEGYQEWNPFIVRASGDLQVGGLVDFETNVPGLEPRINTDVPITFSDGQREFRWGGALWHDTVFFGEQKFALVEIGEDKTKFVHEEKFKGAATKFLNLKGPFTEAFKNMDQALKERVEGRYQ